MAAGKVTTLNKARHKVGLGLFDFDNDTFKLALCEDGQALGATFVGASTDARYADLTDEVPNGSGYTTGGFALAGVTWTQAVAVATFDATDLTISALTATAKYAVIYDDTLANKDILAIIDLAVGVGAGLVISGGDLVFTWNASGLFTVTEAP